MYKRNCAKSRKKLDNPNSGSPLSYEKPPRAVSTERLIWFIQL